MFGFVNLKKCLSSPNHFFKLLVVVCCLSFSVYQVAQCVQRLLNPPITTYYGFHLNESMAYPRVTICRRPGYKTDRFPKYGLRTTQTIHHTNVFRNFDFDNYTIKEFLNETTYTFSEVVGSYAFNGIGFSSAIDYTSFDTTRHGKCYTFIPLEMSEVYSIAGGWWFYLPHDLSVKTLDVYGVSGNGFHVYVHAANEIMSSDDEQDDNFLEYIYLEAMEDIRLHLRYQEFQRVHTNENPCVDPADQPYYSRSRCVEECFHYQIANQTNCTLPWLWMVPEDHLPQCNTVEEVSLLVNLFLRHNRQSLIANCSCPMSCHVSIYTPTIISRKEIDESNSPHGFIAMFYTNNLVTQMKEVVGYNFTAFISDIGGSLGFLLGLSVVGLIRVLEKIVCSCIKNYYEKKKKPEEEQNSETQSNTRSSFSGSTKIVDDLSLGKSNNSIQPNGTVNLYENLKDFDSDAFKSYQKTLVTENNRRF